MAWDFETDPDYQAQLDWADEFVGEEVEPLDLVWRRRQFSPPDDRLRQVIDPLKEEVRKRRLWATHLGSELGGEGHGQLLRDYSPSDGLWPSQHIPARLAAAREKYAEYLEHEIGNQ